MKAFLFLITFLLICLAKAEDVPTVKVPVQEGFKDMDMNQFKDIEADPSHSNVVIDCKLPSGKILSQGDRGFEKCVSHASKQKNKPLKPKRVDEGL